MATFELGMNGKLYEGAEDAALADMSEVTNARDVTVTLDTGEADVTTRGNSGWRATTATLRGCTIEFEAVWKSDDTVMEAIRDAYLGGNLLAFAALTGAVDTAGSEGPKGNFAISNFSRSEALEEAIMLNVTLTLAEFDEWVEDGVEATS